MIFYNNLIPWSVNAACLEESRRSRVRAPPDTLAFLKKQNVSSPLTRKDSILWGGSVRDRAVAYSATDRQGSNFESCVWRALSSIWAQICHKTTFIHLLQNVTD